jgi:hypothetical protein
MNMRYQLTLPPHLLSLNFVIEWMDIPQMRQTPDINGFPSLDPLPLGDDDDTPTKLPKPHNHDIDDIMSGPTEKHKHKPSPIPETKCAQWDFCQAMQEKWRIVAGILDYHLFIHQRYRLSMNLLQWNRSNMG